MSPIILTPGSSPTRRTFKELQDEVLAHGFDDTRYRTRVKAWLNEGLQRAVRAARLPEHESFQPIATAIGVNAYGLELDVVRVRSVRVVDEPPELDNVDITDIDRAGSARGKPAAYALLGGDLILYPTPDAVYNLEVRYWSAPVKMVNDDDKPSLSDDFADVLIQWALGKAYAAEDDFEASQFHRLEYDRGLAELKVQRRRGARVRRIAGMFSSDGARPRFSRPS